MDGVTGERCGGGGRIPLGRWLGVSAGGGSKLAASSRGGGWLNPCPGCCWFMPGLVSRLVCLLSKLLSTRGLSTMGVVAVKVGRSLHIEARAILRFFRGVTKSGTIFDVVYYISTCYITLVLSVNFLTAIKLIFWDRNNCRERTDPRRYQMQHIWPINYILTW